LLIPCELHKNQGLTQAGKQMALKMTKKQTEEIDLTNQKQKSEISELRSGICDNH